MFASGASAPFNDETQVGVSTLADFRNPLRDEQRFVAAGCTALQAWQTATLNPARFYGRLQDFGAVRAGQLINLVLPGTNPLANIANTRRTVAVIADGQYHSRPDLDQLQRNLRRIAASKERRRTIHGWSGRARDCDARPPGCESLAWA